MKPEPTSTIKFIIANAVSPIIEGVALTSHKKRVHTADDLADISFMRYKLLNGKVFTLNRADIAKLEEVEVDPRWLLS